MLVGVTLVLTALVVYIGLQWDMLAEWIADLWKSSLQSADKQHAHDVKSEGGNAKSEKAINDKDTIPEHLEEDVVDDSSRRENGTTLKSAESTPKANPTTPSVAVPSFSLEGPVVSGKEENDNRSNVDEDDEDDFANMPPPSFPALNSAQRASGTRTMGPPTLKPLSNAGLMPPPSRPSASLRTPPSAAASLRVPSSGPLSNRGPPRMNGLAVPQGVAVKTPNPRQKVLLQPGHSPLDWANLQRSGKNLAGVNGFQRVTMSQLKEMNGRKGKPAWSSYQGKVYNISPYLPFHPGGEGELRRVAGKDGEKLFMEVHPWVNWDNMLDGCFVGMLVPDREVEVKSLEDLD